METLLRSTIFLCAGVLLLGAVLGVFGDRWYQKQGLGSSRGVIIREGKRKLTNPILACEIASADTFDELKPLQNKIRELAHEKVAVNDATDISVYLRTLNSGRWIGVDEEKKYTPASLLKVLVMMGYLKAAESNPALLAKTIFYSAGKKQTDTNGSSGLAVNTSYTTEILIGKMVTDSSNEALYLLIDNLPEDSLKQTFEDLNIPLPQFPTEETIEVMSPRTYSLVFQVLYGASYLNRDMSEKALEILSRTTFTEGIVADLPSSLTAAHKFGSQTVTLQKSNVNVKTKELHDCGIVYYPDHPYLICIMTKGNDIARLASSISDISRLVYDEIDRFFKEGK